MITYKALTDHQRMKKTLMILIFIPLLYLITSCSSQEMVQPDLGIERINRDFRILAPEGWNTYKIGDTIGLDVEVTSSFPIAFEPDYGAKIFLKDEKDWVELENLLEYTPDVYQILYPAEGDYFKHGGVSLRPLIEDNMSPVVLRIFLVGHIIRNEEITEELTTTYIDLSLEP